jgi:hypothetical protein
MWQIATTARWPSTPRSRRSGSFGANTLGAALRQSEHGVAAQRTVRFRHTGNLQAKFAEAHQILGMTINYQKLFKALADRLALGPIREGALERRVLRHLKQRALDLVLAA